MTGDNSRNIEFILLHSTKYGERSLVLHTLSREYGRCAFFLPSITSGGKSGKSRIANLISPLNIVEASVHQGKGGMPTVSSLCPSVNLGGLRDNLYKSSISIYLAELLFRAVKEGANEPGLYGWCEQKILLLNALQDNFSNFHLMFTLELSAALGFRPEYRDIENFIEADYRHTARELLRMPLSEALILPMNGTVRSSLLESFIRYIELHLEYPLNLRSIAVLKELLQ
ncbi:MAG: recombination protein O N-terminal domain-containing protein [Candidatus Cryptobacteroides sp.]|nr:recombination protein O N-terminal domain-containing protein [Candidatus Cryptobacteroides sp.]